MLRVDFHTHTADDPCDRIPYSTEELIERASQVGLDAVAVTLHDRWFDVRRVEAAARSCGITVIPGIERTIEGRHVLLINFPSEATALDSFEELARLKARHGHGLVIAPHPFFPLPHSLAGLLDRHGALFDAIEYSGCCTGGLNFNRAAVRWARAGGKPMVGCSDAHRLSVVGKTCSLVDAGEPTADDICAAVKAGRVQVSARPLSPAHFAIYAAQLVLTPNRRQAPLDASPEPDFRSLNP
jgi:predicted metal-dependent phosphoesterase TrpH